MRPGSSVEMASSPGSPRGTGWPVSSRIGDMAAGLGVAGGARWCRAGGGAGEVGRNLGHAEGFVDVGSCPCSPRLAQGVGQAFPGREAVAEMGKRREVGAQKLAIDAGGGREDRCAWSVRAVRGGSQAGFRRQGSGRSRQRSRGREGRCRGCRSSSGHLRGGGGRCPQGPPSAGACWPGQGWRVGRG